jgi:hypothetical protein
MIREESLLAASGAGMTLERSRMVMAVPAKEGRWVRAKAVLSPKTPAPTMRTEEGAKT